MSTATTWESAFMGEPVERPFPVDALTLPVTDDTRMPLRRDAPVVGA